MPLYHISENSSVAQIKQASYPKERDLQKLFEDNLETLLGVRFVASEFTKVENPIDRNAKNNLR